MPRAFKNPATGKTATFPDETTDAVVGKVLGVDPSQIRRHVISDPAHVMVAAHARRLPRGATPADVARMDAGGAPPVDPMQAERARVAALPPGSFALGGEQAGGPTQEQLQMAGGALGSLLAPEIAVPAAVAKFAPAIGAGIKATMAGAGGILGGDLAGPPQDPLRVAGTQAAYSLGGDVVAGTAKGLGRAAMTAAMNLTPEAAQTAIREGISATGKGLARLKDKIVESAGVANRILQRAGQNGNLIPAKPFIDRLRQTLMGGAAENFLPSGASQEAAYRHWVDDFLTRNHVGGPGRYRDFTPIQLNRLVQIADDEASVLHEQAQAAAKGFGPPGLDDNQSARLNALKGFADQGRQLLRIVTNGITEVHPNLGPLTLEEAKARTGNLIQLRDVIAPPVAKSKMDFAGQLMRRGAVPATSAAAGATLGALGAPGHRVRGGFEGAAAGAIMSNPQLLSRLALMLSNPAVAATLQQVPRGVGSVLQ